MSEHHPSLREAVTKWFDLSDTPRVSITRLRCPGIDCGCVRAELATSTSPLVILFFRHEAGCWRLFPPSRRYSG
ncbi:hypothetical protein R82526_02852 [Ralstonia mannitolilytica]|uniref:Transposase n=1 Tax=Ralstonia mannitolilytica TaxID=105219 RepID=A0AAD2AKT2_9RALS|nr:hypothetical protein [Ralstonia mannitolilytica]ATG21802.1 hypothetical protein CO705_17890 [Ralstonia pickettii]CAJ0682003.1 hypothetical protein R77591_01617 [Ralstonia mannitolilytica]CAJ0686663.1 hypothetical protein R82526_02852 [Ralstonia mannitolilytica]CAJ0705405.1 hypothetical protein LMG18102_04465 [Ralstonia mannitolilytica]CAJ0867087.1 hypothetical protein R77569_01945 [Ralstonia mannitolilytica]